MSAFTRKQLSLSLENLSSLQKWSDLYGVSESELVRRAIQAYDPEETRCSPIAEEQERDVAAVLDCITEALRSARESVERTNARVNETLMNLGDPAQRIATAREARREIVENPGFLDEVADLI
ncbi:hypothetical protein [Marinobacter changyiensis]|uniref:hypothetical protein n=1 Tax=Marinobacter changyiensis TaxID=2604091 RepID=UPI001265064B|nr:hypothetical protein [Marinobacter changyiensis]